MRERNTIVFNQVLDRMISNFRVLGALTVNGSSKPFVGLLDACRSHCIMSTDRVHSFRGYAIVNTEEDSRMAVRPSQPNVHTHDDDGVKGTKREVGRGTFGR